MGAGGLYGEIDPSVAAVNIIDEDSRRSRRFGHPTPKLLLLPTVCAAKGFHKHRRSHKNEKGKGELLEAEHGREKGRDASYDRSHIFSLKVFSECHRAPLYRFGGISFLFLQFCSL